jgi:transcriptional regulator with XRE-family HTH domain
MTSEHISKRLQALRQKHGLTLGEVGRAINVPTSTYRDWEYGSEIKGEPYQKLAKLFGVSLTFLITGHNNKETKILNEIIGDMEKDLQKLKLAVQELELSENT